MKAFLLKLFYDNFDRLLDLDYKWALRLGAPKGYTLSAYAYLEKNLFWKVLRKLIDFLARVVRRQQDHCKLANIKHGTLGQ